MCTYYVPRKLVREAPRGQIRGSNGWNTHKSQGWKRAVHVYVLSHVWLFVTLWTVAGQAPLFMRFFQVRILEWVVIFYSRGSFWPGNQIHTSETPALAGSFFTTVSPEELRSSRQHANVYPVLSDSKLCTISSSQYWQLLNSRHLLTNNTKIHSWEDICHLKNASVRKTSL